MSCTPDNQFRNGLVKQTNGPRNAPAGSAQSWRGISFACLRCSARFIDTRNAPEEFSRQLIARLGVATPPGDCAAGRRHSPWRYTKRRIRTEFSNPSLRCREMEVLGQRQTARKGAGAQDMALGRQATGTLLIDGAIARTGVSGSVNRTFRVSRARERRQISGRRGATRGIGGGTGSTSTDGPIVRSMV